VNGVDYVLHQAAFPSVPRSIEDPVSSNEVNISGTLHLLVAARDAGVRRLVFASSSSVYGEIEALPKVESMSPAPISPYALQKLAAETYCRMFHRLYGLETVALRYFNIFGPRQDPTSDYAAVVPKFVRALREGRRPRVFGDGEQSRDFTFVANAVQVNLKACEAGPDALGRAYNVGCGARFTLNQLLEQLGELMGVDPDPEYGDPRPGDVRHSLADIGEAERRLGYRPEVDFRSGLQRTLEWF
jgi:nucleoside-diphosphate-sugar epimerase